MDAVFGSDAEKLNLLISEVVSTDLFGFENFIVFVFVFFAQVFVGVLAEHDERVDFADDVVAVGADNNVEAIIDESCEESRDFALVCRVNVEFGSSIMRMLPLRAWCSR